jgi:hypothetical protein
MDDSKMGDFMKLVEQSITNESTQNEAQYTAVCSLAMLKKLACYRIKSGNLKIKLNVVKTLLTRRYVSFNSIAIKTKIETAFC